MDIHNPAVSLATNPARNVNICTSCALSIEKLIEQFPSSTRYAFYFPLIMRTELNRLASFEEPERSRDQFLSSSKQCALCSMIHAELETRGHEDVQQALEFNDGKLPSRYYQAWFRFRWSWNRRSPSQLPTAGVKISVHMARSNGRSSHRGDALLGFFANEG
jgi:hypothetical protein